MLVAQHSANSGPMQSSAYDNSRLRLALEFFNDINCFLVFLFGVLHIGTYYYASISTFMVLLVSGEVLTLAMSSTLASVTHNFSMAQIPKKELQERFTKYPRNEINGEYSRLLSPYSHSSSSSSLPTSAGRDAKAAVKRDVTRYVINGFIYVVLLGMLLWIFLYTNKSFQDELRAGFRENQMSQTEQLYYAFLLMCIIQGPVQIFSSTVVRKM